MTDVLTRLLLALSRDPALEYQLWKRMRTLRFHGPWEADGEGRYVLTTEDDDEVADIEQNGNCWSWAIVNGDGGESWTVDEAKTEVEGRLWIDGWRFVPEGEWIPSPRPRATRDGIALGPWTQDVGTNTWSRCYASLAPAASVGWASEQSAVEWATWTDGARSRACVLEEGREITIEWAKYRADQDLLDRKLISRAQATDLFTAENSGGRSPP